MRKKKKTTHILEPVIENESGLLCAYREHTADPSSKKSMCGFLCGVGEGSSVWPNILGHEEIYTVSESDLKLNYI